MKVLVAIKRVVDYKAKVRVMQNGKGVEKQGIQMSINPFCAIAVEQAVKMKENKKIKEVTVLTIGCSKSEDVLRKSLAMGADKAIHVVVDDQEIDNQVQPIHVATILKKVIKKNNYSFCILGKQSIDGDYNQTGQMLSQMLGWGQSTFLSKLESLGEKGFQVEKEVDGGVQRGRVGVNSVLTCDLRLNKPRIPRIPMVVKAKKIKIEKMEYKDFDMKGIHSIKVLEVREPEKRKGGVMVESVDELLDKLRNEAKVL